MKVSYIFLSALFCLVLALASCNTKEIKDEETPALTPRLKGDKAVYGLACDGCNDTVIVLLPETMGDPKTYNIYEAKRKGHVLGKIQIGDRLCVVPNKEDSTKADLVVDMNKLLGIWCYIVMPQPRNAMNMSASMQEQMMNNMSDSLKAIYLIPREYGFYLKPDWQAQSVGYVDDNNSLADESPVVYPSLGYFTGWRLWNGQLMISSGTPLFGKDGQIKITNRRNDTCSIDYLDDDSLVLSSDGISRSYYKKKNINELNRKAQAIANKLKKEAISAAVNTSN